MVGLCETKTRGEGLRELSWGGGGGGGGGSWMYEAGKTEENPNTKCLALIITKTSLTVQTNLKSIQTELSRVKLNHREKLHYKITVYVSTSDHDDETVEMFYEELGKARDTIACSHHIVIGDFNAKTGVRNINENMKCIGPFGTGSRNERGESFLDFAEGSSLVVANSFFINSANRYWTREALGGVIINQIDFILSSDRKIVGNCEVITKEILVVTTEWSEQE